MSIAQGSKKHNLGESPVFGELSLYKVVKTNRGKTVMLHLDGSVSTVVEFKGINNTSFTEGDFENIFQRIKTTLDDVQNTNMSVQFVMMRNNKLDIKEELQDLPSYLEPRKNYLDNLAKNYDIFDNTFYLAIHNKNSSKKEKGNKGIFKKFYTEFIKKEEQSKEINGNMSNIQDIVTDVIEITDSLVNMLNDIGSTTKVYTTKKEYYDMLQNFTRPNKSKTEKIEIDDSVESPRRTIFSGVRATTRKKDFTLDDYFHRVYMLDRVPKRPLFGQTIEVIEKVPFEFIYSVTFSSITHKDAIKKFKFKMLEKKMQSGQNNNALIEDRSLMADEKRISDSYDQFAYGDGYGLNVSCNFILRMNEENIEKLQIQEGISREDALRRLDQKLLKRVFAGFGGSEWINEESTGWDIFCNILPGMSSTHNYALKKMFLTTENIPYFMAIYDNERDIPHNGINHFIDERGNIVTFELMDPDLPAWNYSISGQTGSGKSVLMNTILTMQFAESIKGKSPVICILDVGGDRGSYTKFMKLVGGTEINLSGSKKPSIQMMELVPERSLPKVKKTESLAKLLKDNGLKDDILDLENAVRNFFEDKIAAKPEDAANDRFLRSKLGENLGLEGSELKILWEIVRESFKLKVGECKPSDQKTNQIMGILEVMLSTSAKRLDAFSVYDYDEILEIVNLVYEEIDGRQTSITDLYEFCSRPEGGPLDLDDTKARKLITKIKNYTRKYGQFPMFDKETEIDVNNDVILADLKGLESSPQLQIIYTLLLSQLFNDKMYFIRDRKKLIVRDEAWSVMRNERARKFFEEDLRTARKNGFATISISQLPTDYMNPDPAVGKGIISNMQVNIFCRFATESICREVGQEYELNEKIVKQMRTLGVQKQKQADGSIKATHGKFMMLLTDRNNKQAVYILNNLLHPFEYALYSSSAEDNAVIEYYMDITKQYEDLQQVLHLMASDGHVGDIKLAEFLEDSGYKNQARKIRGKS